MYMLNYRTIKRILDILFAIILIILTFPFQIVIGLVLLISLKENPLFLQTRGLTHNKFRFTIIKFRTIKSSEISTELHHTSKDIFLLPNLAVKLNGFQKWLRKTGLDELPQIYNVLIGQMSFIGPRPLMIQDLEILKNEFPNHYQLREKIFAKPGISSVWQIVGDRTQGVENLIGLDIFYNKNISFKLDLNIFLATIPLILFAKNSDAIIPRIDFISKFFSSSIAEFRVFNKEVLLNMNTAKDNFKSYSIKLPLNWWYMSDSYSNSGKKDITIINIADWTELKRKSS